MVTDRVALPGLSSLDHASCATGCCEWVLFVMWSVGWFGGEGADRFVASGCVNCSLLLVEEVTPECFAVGMSF